MVEGLFVLGYPFVILALYVVAAKLAFETPSHLAAADVTDMPVQQWIEKPERYNARKLGKHVLAVALIMSAGLVIMVLALWFISNVMLAVFLIITWISIWVLSDSALKYFG